MIRKGIAATFALFIGTIIVLANLGQLGFVGRFLHKLPYGDKWGHFLLFGMMALLLNVALRYRIWRVGGWSLQVGSLLVIAFAWIEELSQLAFPNRTCDLTDALADLFGVLLFTFFSLQLKRLEERHQANTERAEGGALPGP